MAEHLVLCVRPVGLYQTNKDNEKEKKTNTIMHHKCEISFSVMA